ncbi:MAG: ribonuclease HII [Chlamydiales bacterium]|nr:ribonuclease HII [Chlamydiales bacterium]
MVAISYKKHTAFEETARQKGYQFIAGVDEAGRGPLAGPVVASACILPKGLVIDGVNDSKKLTPEKRAELFKILTENPQISFGIGVVDAPTIDQINILQASLLAMQIAIDNLPEKPDFILVDGPHLPKTQIPGLAVVHGDSRVFSIAAASIIAKVTRDQMMREYDAKYPQYGFIKHKGYGTAAHLSAIAAHGPSPLHRMSFHPFTSREEKG